MPSRVLTTFFLCFALFIGGAVAKKGSGGGYGFAHGGLNGRRMLAGESLLSSIGKGGSFTDWTVPCEPGRARCPSLFLASHGYQCTTLNGQACCKQGNGKQCALAVAWALMPIPKTWRGRNLVGGSKAPSPPPPPAPTPPKPASPTPPPPPPAKPVQLTAEQLLAYNLTETEPPAGYVLINSAKKQQTTKTIGGAVAGQGLAANATQQQDSSQELADDGDQQSGSGQETGGQQQDSDGSQQPGGNSGHSDGSGNKGNGKGGKGKGKGKGRGKGNGKGKGKQGNDKKKRRDNSPNEDPTDTGSSSGGSSSGGKGDSKQDGKDSSSSSGGKWQKATATYYHSYPPCCHDSSADQSECDDFSGCKWEGQFAGLGHKPESWVKKNDIVAFFEAPNGKNRKEWERKWNGKKLRLKHPDNGNTLDVTVVDTCDDDDCEGCCTQNARKNGGFLVDLEINTARRFWGDKVRGLAGIQFQVLDD